jgi:transketolase
MSIVVPCDPRETDAAVRAIIQLGRPAYLRLSRSNDRILPGTDGPFLFGTPTVLRSGRNVALLASGAIATEALEAADVLTGDGLDPAVLSVHTVKPLGGLVDFLEPYRDVFVVEEHGPHGGLFDAVAGAMARAAMASPTLRQISSPDHFHQTVGSSAFLRKISRIDAAAIRAIVSTALEPRHR